MKLFDTDIQERQTLSLHELLFFMAILSFAMFHELIFYADLNFLSLQLNTHIVHEYFFSPHELTFYADQDFHFLLFDSHIAHKDILFFHELTFYADQDFLLLLLDTHIAHKDIVFEAWD